MQEHRFSAFLHQFPDLHSRPGLKPVRIQMKRDARKAPAGLRASLYNIVFSKRKELTTDPRFRISVVNLISIRAIFSNLNLVQAKKSLFLLRISCFQDLIPPSPPAFGSNLPGGRGEIDDETSGQSVSASISSAFPEKAQIRGLSGILVRGVCERSHSNYSIPSAFEAQARSIRNSLRLRRSGSLSRTPSAISSYIPFGIGTVPRAPLEFTTTNRDSPSSSK